MSSICPEASREETQGGFKAALPLMLGRVVGFAATFFIPVILARIFEPAQFGTYRQLFLIYGTLYGVAQLGMAESLLYFLPMARRHPGRYVTNATLVIGVTGLVCLLCLQEARGTISRWLVHRRGPRLNGQCTVRPGPTATESRGFRAGGH